MELIDLEIRDFKSIITPQRLRFSDHFMMVIGKNGSGKSNFLQGIASFFALLNGQSFYKGAKYQVRISIGIDECPHLFVAPNKNNLKKVTATFIFNDDNNYDILWHLSKEKPQKLDINSEFGNKIMSFLKRKCSFLDYEHFVFDSQKTLHLFHELFFEVCENQKWLPYKASHQLSDYSSTFIESLFPKFIDYLREATSFYPSLFEHIKLAVVDGFIQCYILGSHDKEIALVDTNTGQRWLGFYHMLSHQLKEGDVFLIDEPAAFLHPEAQLMVLKHMESMVNDRKIYLIYSTHSPYMLSEKFPCFYYAELTKRGTIIQHHLLKDLPYIRDQMRFLDLNTMILNLNRTYILVEGQSDVACFKKFMEYFHIDSTKYEVLQIDGAGNMKSITHFLSKNNLKYIRILDADQKPFYSSETDVVFVGEDQEEKRLEGLFSQKDRRRYFKGAKVDAEKVRKGQSFTPLTIKNFQELFKKIKIV